MRRLLVIAAVLVAAGCSSGTPAGMTPSQSELFSEGMQPYTPDDSPGAPDAGTDTDTPCQLPTSPDLIVWSVAPGTSASAQILGSANLASCTTTMDYLSQTSPTEPGYCTEVALSSDNPEYDADAVPAAPLEDVMAQFGPAC